MTPFHSDPWLTVYQGDCREVMTSMEPQSVHCVVTSPPYWGLRDYGTATWIGGDEGCDHLARTGRGAQNLDALGERLGTGGGHKASSDEAGNSPFRGSCGKCGAIREDAQLGLEPTPEEYVANMVAVFRAVRRVLRDDGTVWLNLGDSYASTTKGDDRTPEERSRSSTLGPKRDGLGGGNSAHIAVSFGTHRVQSGLKPKDLVGIPWRVAFALQADGWYLRSDIIWAKPNPMPESVTDRPTKAHEYVFLLSKSARYWYDAEAVREPHSDPNVVGGVYQGNGGRNRAEYEPSTQGFNHADGSTGGVRTMHREYNPAGRNLRSVWSIATQPYPGAHFATFPEKLVEPCIKAGCPELGTVLDPFAGSGTTGRVAQRLSRRAVLIDLNGEYLVQAMERNRELPLGLEAS